MSKPGRNDPCPCGSGKKYKKCCGKNNVVAFDTTLYTNELDRLHQQLINFAFEESKNDLFSIGKHFAEKYSSKMEEEQMDTFLELAIGWAIFTLPVEDEKTLFDLFYKKVKDKIRYPAVKKTFADWSAAESGFFEVFPADDYHELSDLATGKSFKTSRNEERDFERGSIVIGTLLPYTDTYEFFSLIIQLPEVHAETISELVNDKLPTDVTMKDVFPQILADMFDQDRNPKVDMSQFDWHHIEHKKVALTFIEHARQKGYDEELIQMTIQYWSDYCSLRHPTVRKHAAHAAALDYFSQTDFSAFTDATQAKLAKEYETSPGTISNHYRKLTEDYDSVVDMLEMDNPSSEPVNMEKQMRDMMRMIEEQEFNSEEELNNFLQGGLNFDDLPKSQDPRDIAQDLLFEADEESGGKRKELIQKALNVYPLSSDAYALLAEDERDINKRMELLKKAIDVGEQDLGDAFFKENHGHFWGLIETRPYMRAKATYGTTLEELGLTKEAIEIYTDLLELNPNDNQGIRYMLLSLYIMDNNFEKAHTLIDEYDEASATFLFSEALLNFKEKGITKNGIEMLRDAHDSNPYVIDYLLGEKRIPRERPSYVGFGDEMEAIAYVQDNVELWNGAEEFLKKI